MEKVQGEFKERNHAENYFFFLEPSDDAFYTPAKIGDILMNRFAIDEDASCEILKRFELVKTSVEMTRPSHINYKCFTEEREQKGLDHFIVIVNIQI